VDRLREYRNEIVSLHDAGIRWVDTQLARLVDGLRSLSLWDSTVFVQTADHGEEFLDHGGRFHFPSRAYQELLHVPLLIRVPGVQVKPVSDTPFSHVHLAPTVLDAMGIDPPPEFQGRSHWTAARRGGEWEWAVSESIGRCTAPLYMENRMKSRVLAVQDRRYKLMLDFEHKQEELFDLESDPRELHALPPEAEAAVRARLLGWALQHLNRPGRGFKTELAIRARLREVGLEWKNSKMDSKILAS
jgi:arylsulfatase A-like enzyme